jgi:hypothetical protein
MDLTDKSLMILTDKSLLDKIIKLEIPVCASNDFVLGKDIMDELNNILSSLESENNDLYSQEEKIKELWIKLLDKSIKCLKYYDQREPFMKYKNKKPETYRMEDLKSYFDQFSSFEGMLYGSNNEYRDHIIHVFRTWLLGVFILLNKSSKNTEKIINKIVLDGVINCAENNTKYLFNPTESELLSMWTLISLCHDLGYPLEKRDGIIKKTEEMMVNFFPNANITMTYNNISGVHDESIRNIVKFISSVVEGSVIRIGSYHKTKYSSKIRSKYYNKFCKSPQKIKYSSRIQSKYYNKISKSLESFSHGIISAIILFKSLEYFSESDFSIEGDYSNSIKDAKQFYIRREILRSIAVHTCSNVYHIKITTLPFLLILCDELQEWDRRTFMDFYSGKQNIDYKMDLNLRKLKKEEVRICESLAFKKDPDYEELFNKYFDKYFNQYEKYKKIFRDGLDTKYREFSFTKEVKIKNKEIVFIIDISKDKGSNFIIEYKTKVASNEFNKIIKKINKKYKFVRKGNSHFVFRREY